MNAFFLSADDGRSIPVLAFLPEDPATTRAVVVIVHGMAEHAARYAPVGEALVRAGHAAYAFDLRGHGPHTPPADLGHPGDRDTFAAQVADLRRVVREAGARHPGAPRVVLGHSMGTFVVQQLMVDGGAGVDGWVLSAGAIMPSPLVLLGRVVSRLERLRQGGRGRSALIEKLSFGSYNKAFEPARTRFDWLSRDPDQVDRYVADPLCGFLCSNQLWVDLTDATARLGRPGVHARLPKDAPVLVFTGAHDPVTDRAKGTRALEAAWRKAGLTRLEVQVYPEGRHESFNDVHRDRVLADLIAWLEARLPKETALRSA